MVQLTNGFINASATLYYRLSLAEPSRRLLLLMMMKMMTQLVSIQTSRSTVS